MKVRELIEELSKLDQDANIAVPDDAGGWEFVINLATKSRIAEGCKESEEPFSTVSIY